MDDTTFAEAMLAVNDLQQIGKADDGPLSLSLDAALMESHEAEDQPLEADPHSVAAWTANAVVRQDSMGSSAVTNFARSVLQNAWDLFWRALKWLLLEACTFCVLMLPYALIMSHDAEVEEGRAALAHRLSDAGDERLGWGELLLRPGIALLVARAASASFKFFFKHWLYRALPANAILTCQCFLGWPLTVLIWQPGMLLCMSFLHLDAEAWEQLGSVPTFIATSAWWIVAATSRGILEVVGRSWLTKLTLHVFEERANRAQQANRALRRIFSAAWVTEEARRKATAEERRRRQEIAKQAARLLLQEAVKASKENARRKSVDVRASKPAVVPRWPMKLGGIIPGSIIPASRSKDGLPSSVPPAHRRTSSLGAAGDTASSKDIPTSRSKDGLQWFAPAASSLASSKDSSTDTLPTMAPDLASIVNATSYPTTKQSPIELLAPAAAEPSGPAESQSVAPLEESSFTYVSPSLELGGSKDASTGLGGLQQGLGASPDVASLNTKMTGLAGPLQFGGKFTEASTLAQASKRARRVFEMIVLAAAEKPELLLPSDEQGAQPNVAFPFFFLTPTRHRSTRLASLSVSLTSSPSYTPTDPTDRYIIDAKAMLKWAFLLYASRQGRSLRVAAQEAEQAAAALSLGVALDEDGFVSFIERCYKEQRNLTAAHKSFSKSQQQLQRAWVVPWALLFGAVGIFIWGIEISTWLIPATSLVLSVSFLLGSLPSQMLAGALYALVSRPFEIGDSIRVARPAWGTDTKNALWWGVVKEQDLLHTYLISQYGEVMALENHILRTLLVTNITNSGPPNLIFQIQVPAAGPTAKITELIDAMATYASVRPEEWVTLHMHFCSHEISAGHLVLEIWGLSAIPAHEVVRVNACKSRLLLFVHAYMQTSNMQYFMPAFAETNTQPAELIS